LAETKKQALISVYDKTGVVEFAKGLVELGWEIISTGGTARTLQEAGVEVKQVSAVTGSPEILGGRVKTLHPRVHGALLARRDKKEHVEELAEYNIATIDLVVVNLYPFEATVAKPGVTPDEAQEEIDIGGVCLLRASGKNYPFVAIVSDPDDYTPVLESLKSGDLSDKMRLSLAVKAFKCTAHYDTAIGSYLESLCE